MAITESKVREGLNDISFDQYRFPSSPPFTPQIKGDARMADSRNLYTPINPTLDKMFPRSPPSSPRNGLKRKFSTNLQSALNGMLTPPSTPPTLSRSSTLVKGSDGSVFPTHRRPTVTPRPTVVTVDFNGSPSLLFPSMTFSSRSSSYSSSVATPRSSRDALARCKDYAALSTDAQFPLASPSPLYFNTGSTPPPNTPMNPLSGMMMYLSAGTGTPFEPFPSFYAGPSNLSTVSTPVVELAPMYPNLPRPEDFDFSSPRTVNPAHLSLSHRPNKRKFAFYSLVLIMINKLVLIRLRKLHLYGY